MAKYLKKAEKRRGKRIPVIAAVLAVLLGLGAVLILNREPSDGPETGEAVIPQPSTLEVPETQPLESQPSPTDPAPSAAAPEASIQPALEYPVVLEDGKLIIDDLFQYDGANPDGDFEENKNIACVMVKNVSGEYLENANLTLTLTDGTVANFTVNQLPAGKAAMAFATDSTTIKADALCVEAVCNALWNAAFTPLPEGVSISVEDILVTVTNNTGRNIPQLVIYCRCSLGEAYFGGITYPYTINNLPAHESAAVEAWDCVFGMAEVVRVVMNEE